MFPYAINEIDGKVIKKFPILIASPKMKIRINLSRLGKVYTIKCWGIGNEVNKRKYNPFLKNLKNIVEIPLQLKMMYTSNAMPI